MPLHKASLNKDKTNWGPASAVYVVVVVVVVGHAKEDHKLEAPWHGFVKLYARSFCALWPLLARKQTCKNIAPASHRHS